MKKIVLPFLIILSMVLMSCNRQKINLSNDSFSLKLNNNGNVISMKVNKKEYLYKNNKVVSPLLSVRVNNEFEYPSSVVLNDSILTFSFSKNNLSVGVRFSKHDKYLKFEVVDVPENSNIELVQWGPFATTISKIVGECVGVVRDDNNAIGIQSLNAKTIGGYPDNENDIDPSFEIKVPNSLCDISDTIKMLYRGQTAKYTDYGSVLQAYCRNRDKDRIISQWEQEYYVSPAWHDGGIKGSAIALFGCSVGKTLDCIEAVELGEGLPHPMINGVWSKRSPEATRAYLIYPFTENDIDEAIALTKKAGLEYLYQLDAFDTWGKFKLNPQTFPHGLDGLKACVEKAAESGIKIGVHTLSNFITPNDNYVTPVPDARLAKVGSSFLVKEISSNETEIEIADNKFFNQMKNNTLHGVMIGGELISYESVSDSKPYILHNCKRGAWGTKVTPHSKGDTISKLMDHPYKVFLSDAYLTQEIGRNIADIFNYTGINQISFDGLEGTWSTGLGQYGLSLLVKSWYDELLPERRNCINDASMTSHYNWHTFTRMNWGEPWYAGFRESQLNLRLINQDFYRRNYIPCMLGWFNLGNNTTIEDIEWLLARSAAFDAGYALVADKKSVESNGQSDMIFAVISKWENARMSQVFPDSLKKEMEHIANEYTLEQLSNNEWMLYPYDLNRFTYNNNVDRYQKPVKTTRTFNNKYVRQSLQFLIRADEQVSDVTFEIGRHAPIHIFCTLNKGEYLKYTGGNEVLRYDSNLHVVEKVEVDSRKFNINEGSSNISFYCTFSEKKGHDEKVSVELKTIGKGIYLSKNN